MSAPDLKNSPDPKDAGAMTSTTAHYLELKKQYPDYLLFYRIGDFFELFFEDAEKASAALSITLTRRGKLDGKDIPLAGVPVQTADHYLAKLIRAGFKVAVCDQMEDAAEAKKRGGKSPIRREVVRIVTPGTLTEDTLLDAARANYLAAIAESGGNFAVAWLDLSTGFFAVEAIPDQAGAHNPTGRIKSDLSAILSRLHPSEILLAEKLLQREELFELWGDWRGQLSPQPNSRFDSENGRHLLQNFYHLATLDGLGKFDRAELAAAGALLAYVELTQKGLVPRLDRLTQSHRQAMMRIDPASLRNLEVTRAMAGGREGSLLAAIDHTLTAGGARLLQQWLVAPLLDRAVINTRLDAVEFLTLQPALIERLRKILQHAADVERPLQRLSMGRGGPRDLLAIRQAMLAGLDVREALRPQPAHTAPLPALLADASQNMGRESDLLDRLERALRPDLPITARDGGFIAPGYAAELDSLVLLRDQSRKAIADYQAQLVRATGISSLRIKHNGILGYFIEINPKDSDKISKDFIHRQALVGAVRYTDPALAELERGISGAAEKSLALELKLFDDLLAEIKARSEALVQMARHLALVDCLVGLADLAVKAYYTRPILYEEPVFRITGGRHPVVEQNLPEIGNFIANNCDLSPESAIWLVSGPNMAGKSTFLRQNALIAILAQMGSFVPAARAEIGVIDRVFSRVGAADDLARGRSTFMVEMVETAAILHQATPRSFVILDEIGRGTATFDGLSIAWAVLEHLHEINHCRTLFASHYHELEGLSARLAGLTCHTMKVKEWQGDLIFLHEVIDGSAEHSYGVHVARLAGLPPSVLARASDILHFLEQRSEERPNAAAVMDDLPLFQSKPSAKRPKSGGLGAVVAAEMAHSPPPPPPVTDELRAALRGIDPDSLTPRQAMEMIYQLKGLV
ncbi:MAG: DNA mismatch repair protein MutS [Candidatus Symbiobacter sp.]|nr:DNA mismatch repair protein MutS [Candidatus Symbiobacter sp.]